jgi:uncharacterized membrane protein YuzA (DUF378 family)
VGPARSRKITWQIIDTDNVINWVLGISLILVPDFFNKLLFGHEVISHWIYIVLGISSIWFAIWQLDNFIKNRQLTVQALRFSALLSWVTVAMLLVTLLSSLSGRMLLVSRVLLWVINVSILVLGGWYWWMAEQVRSG